MNLSNLKVRHLMSSPVETLRASQSLPLARAMMDDGGYHHLPVVDSGGKPVGLITHRDLVAAALGSSTAITDEDRSDVELRVPVRRAMTTELQVSRPEEPALRAARLLLREKIGCLPVVEPGGRLIGIITAADFIQLAGKVLANHPPVSCEEVMTPRPITAEPSLPLAAAAELFAEKNIRHLPVTRGGALVGLVTHRDLMQRRRSTLTGVPPFDPEQKLAHLMKTKVVTADAEDALVLAISKMSGDRIGCLPIMRGGALVGILTEIDILRALVDIAGESARMHWRDLPVSYYTHDGCAVLGPDDPAERAGELFATGADLVAIWDGSLLGVVSPSDVLGPDPARPLAELMTRSALAVDVSAPVIKAARALVEHEVHQVLVQRDGTAASLFSRRSCFGVLRDLRLPDRIDSAASTTLFTVGASESIATAAKFLERIETRAVLVEQDEWVVGLVGAEELARVDRAEKHLRAGEVASAAFFCTSSATPLWLACAQAAALESRAVVVVEGGHPVGIFTATDAALRLATLN